MNGQLYRFIRTCVSVFFLTFTLLGVAGFLPSDIQQQVNPNPLISPTVAEAMFGPTLYASGVNDSANDSANTSGTVLDSNGAMTNLADSPDDSPAVNDTNDTSDQYAPIKYTPDGTEEYPVHISIPSVGINATVSNPTSLSDTVLDNDLMSGAVRYPTSGALNDGTNVLLFGHSSYLPVIYHQAYKTFDGLQNLQKGDVIEVDSPDTAYIYTVASVQMLVDSDAVVNIGGNDHELILSTCDVFDEKEDRYMVVAIFTGSHPLVSDSGAGSQSD